jgi:hypothetical protein
VLHEFSLFPTPPKRPPDNREAPLAGPLCSDLWVLKVSVPAGSLAQVHLMLSAFFSLCFFYLSGPLSFQILGIFPTFGLLYLYFLSEYVLNYLAVSGVSLSVLTTACLLISLVLLLVAWPVSLSIPPETVYFCHYIPGTFQGSMNIFQGNAYQSAVVCTGNVAVLYTLLPACFESSRGSRKYAGLGLEPMNTILSCLLVIWLEEYH